MNAHDGSDPLASKREKARERQRKKRERDRSGITAVQQAAAAVQGIPGLLMHELQQHAAIAPQTPIQHHPGPNQHHQPLMSPDEMARKEKVRLAARERQRKHRAVVKARRMAELGLAMTGNPGDPLGYRVNEDGEMEPVHDASVAGGAGPPATGYPPTPGQTFAHLLMASATMNHHMKHHLLRTMQMTGEELASFEPIIAAAWDHWNHQRLQYIHSQAGGESGDFSGRSDPENGDATAGDADMSFNPNDQNDYRARLQKQIEEGTHYTQPPHSNSIDPTLATQAGRETSAMRSQGPDGQDEGEKVSEQATAVSTD